MIQDKMLSLHLSWGISQNVYFFLNLTNIQATFRKCTMHKLKDQLDSYQELWCPFTPYLPFLYHTCLVWAKILITVTFLILYKHICHSVTLSILLVFSWKQLAHPILAENHMLWCSQLFPIRSRPNFFQNNFF